MRLATLSSSRSRPRAAPLSRGIGHAPAAQWCSDPSPRSARPPSGTPTVRGTRRRENHIGVGLKVKLVGDSAALKLWHAALVKGEYLNDAAFDSWDGTVAWMTLEAIARIDPVRTRAPPRPAPRPTPAPTATVLPSSPTTERPTRRTHLAATRSADGRAGRGRAATGPQGRARIDGGTYHGTYVLGPGATTNGDGHVPRATCHAGSLSTAP